MKTCFDCRKLYMDYMPSPKQEAPINPMRKFGPSLRDDPGSLDSSLRSK